MLLPVGRSGWQWILPSGGGAPGRLATLRFSRLGSWTTLLAPAHAKSASTDSTASSVGIGYPSPKAEAAAARASRQAAAPPLFRGAAPGTLRYRCELLGCGQPPSLHISLLWICRIMSCDRADDQSFWFT